MTDALLCWYWLTGWFWMLQLSTQLEHNIDSPAIAATGLERWLLSSALCVEGKALGPPPGTSPL